MHGEQREQQHEFEILNLITSYQIPNNPCGPQGSGLSPRIIVTFISEKSFHSKNGKKTKEPMLCVPAVARATCVVAAVLLADGLGPQSRIQRSV
jgi:hypothetical protein